MQEEYKIEKIKIKNLQDHIIAVLKDFPQSRNSDVVLMIEIVKRYYPKETINGEGTGIRLTTLFRLPREDNIKRIRAKIQNEQGLFLPTSQEVRKKRGIKEEAWLNYVSNN